MILGPTFKDGKFISYGILEETKMNVDVMGLLGQKSAQPTGYNNGKDLMPSDITVLKETDVITGKPKLDSEGREIYHAYLGFVAYTGLIAQAPKFYRATASTAEEAKLNLISVLKDHLDRALQ